MPQDRDELNKRRQQRAAQRKKQLQAQRRFRRRLIAALAVLAICGVALYTLVQEGALSAPQGEDAQTVAATQEVATEPPKTATTTIHIKAAGDLNVTDSSVAAGLTSLGYDYTDTFLDVAAVLADADLTMLNFEGNLVGEPYGTNSASAPQKLAEALAAAGVDIVQMANSYSIYNGMIGLSQTLSNFRAAGIEPVGAFATEEEFSQSKGYTICQVQGISVAVVAFTKGMSGMGLPTGSEDCVNTLYVDYDTTYQEIDREGIRAILKNIQAENPDITIAMVHWGSEYNDTVFDDQETIAKIMMNAGVDIILGTHSHMVHRIDFDDVGNTLVAYSLGDFFGDASKSGTNYSLILDIEITKDNESGTTEIDGYTVTPIYTLTESETKDGSRRVVRIRETMDAYEVNFVDKVTSTAYASMENALSRIDARIAGE